MGNLMLSKEFNPQIYVTIYDIFMKKIIFRFISSHSNRPLI